MFSYYGGKSRIYKRYPPARCSQIIEPFCGAAWYSTRYPQRQIWINDLYTPIIEIWKWLRTATHTDIDNLPELAVGQDIRDMTLIDPLRYLLGFCCNAGNQSPCNVMTRRAEGSCRKRSSSITNFKRNIRPLIGNISHWKVTSLDYNELPDIRATWFIDPPYQYGGHHYVHSLSAGDYANLGRWCLSRKGQIIVCENSNADWLPFKPHTTQSTNRQKFKRNKSNQEVIYHRGGHTFST